MLLLTSCGGLTRTDDLWVMSPTSYQLLHSAMFTFWWALTDSNRRPSACKADALNQLS